MTRIALLSTVFFALSTFTFSLSAQAAGPTGSKSARATGSLLTSSNDSPMDYRLEIEPQVGIGFISPSDINNNIRDINDQVQKGGVKSFSISEMGSTATYGIAATYRVIPELGLGLGFSRLTASTDGSAKVGNGNITATYGLSANMLTVESRLSVFKSNNQKFEFVVSPFAGVGFFHADFSRSGEWEGGSSEVSGKNVAFVGGGSASARIWFFQGLALGLTGGYRYAKSGDLKVDSQKNSEMAVGSKIEANGKKILLDASSVTIGTQLIWAI